MEHTEKAVLGAALAEPGLWLSHADQIEPQIFQDLHALAVQLCAMRDAGHPTDPQSAKTWLDKNGVKMGLADLMELAEHAPASRAGLEVAVDALHDRRKRSELYRLGSRLVAMAQDLKRPPDEIVEELTQQLTAVGASSTGSMVELSKALHEVVTELGRPKTRGVRTGIATLDRFTGGFQPGNLVILGARPSMGKTSLALTISRQAALDGQTVAVFSFEMSTRQVIHRLLSDVGDVDLARISTHRLNQKDMAAITLAANRLHKTRVFIGESDRGIPQVCAQLKNQHKLSLVVVDYLQLMTAKAESRERQIATLSRNLKRMARAVGVPVLALSQLNRAVEQRQCKRPMLSDLRESGAIEQDADLVLLLWREAHYDDEADPTAAELIVAKQRNGPVGSLPLHWDETRARFSQPKTP